MHRLLAAVFLELGQLLRLRFVAERITADVKLPEGCETLLAVKVLLRRFDEHRQIGDFVVIEKQIAPLGVAGQWRQVANAAAPKVEPLQILQRGQRLNAL